MSISLLLDHLNKEYPYSSFDDVRVFVEKLSPLPTMFTEIIALLERSRHETDISLPLDLASSFPVIAIFLFIAKSNDPRWGSFIVLDSVLFDFKPWFSKLLFRVCDMACGEIVLTSPFVLCIVSNATVQVPENAVVLRLLGTQTPQSDYVSPYLPQFAVVKGVTLPYVIDDTHETMDLFIKFVGQYLAKNYQSTRAVLPAVRSLYSEGDLLPHDAFTVPNDMFLPHLKDLFTVDNWTRVILQSKCLTSKIKEQFMFTCLLQWYKLTFHRTMSYLYNGVSSPSLLAVIEGMMKSKCDYRKYFESHFGQLPVKNLHEFVDRRDALIHLTLQNLSLMRQVVNLISVMLSVNVIVIEGDAIIMKLVQGKNLKTIIFTFITPIKVDVSVEHLVDIQDETVIPRHCSYLGAITGFSDVHMDPLIDLLVKQDAGFLTSRLMVSHANLIGIIYAILPFTHCINRASEFGRWSTPTFMFSSSVTVLQPHVQMTSLLGDGTPYHSLNVNEATVVHCFSEPKETSPLTRSRMNDLVEQEGIVGLFLEESFWSINDNVLLVLLPIMELQNHQLMSQWAEDLFASLGGALVKEFVSSFLVIEKFCGLLRFPTIKPFVMKMINMIKNSVHVDVYFLNKRPEPIPDHPLTVLRVIAPIATNLSLLEHLPKILSFSKSPRPCVYVCFYERDQITFPFIYVTASI